MKLQNFIIFYLSLMVQEVFTLQCCYQCSAYKGTSCKSNDYKPCQEQNSICLTQTYKYKFGEGERTRFIKRCGNGWEDCENNCKYIGRRSYDCLVSCCSTNLCNEEVDPQIIWYALLTSGGSVIKSGSKILNVMISALVVLLV